MTAVVSAPGVTPDLSVDVLQRMREGVHEEMMVAILNTMQTAAATCATVCLQRLEQFHHELALEMKQSRCTLSPPPGRPGISATSSAPTLGRRSSTQSKSSRRVSLHRMSLSSDGADGFSDHGSVASSEVQSEDALESMYDFTKSERKIALKEEHRKQFQDKFRSALIRKVKSGDVARIMKDMNAEENESQDSMTRGLRVSVVKATNLKQLSSEGSDAPWCRCEIRRADRTAKPVSFQTRPIEGTLNPEWNETHDFRTWQAGDALDFMIFSKCVGGSRFQGRVHVPYERFKRGGFKGSFVLEELVKTTLHVDIQVVGDVASLEESPKEMLKLRRLSTAQQLQIERCEFVKRAQHQLKMSMYSHGGGTSGLLRMMNQFDVDGSGTLNKIEFAALLEEISGIDAASADMMEGHIEALVASIDVSGIGEISPDDVMNFIEYGSATFSSVPVNLPDVSSERKQRSSQLSPQPASEVVNLINEFEAKLKQHARISTPSTAIRSPEATIFETPQTVAGSPLRRLSSPYSCAGSLEQALTETPPDSHLRRHSFHGFVNPSTSAVGLFEKANRNGQSPAPAACTHEDGFREHVDASGERYHICDLCGATQGSAAGSHRKPAHAKQLASRQKSPPEFACALEPLFKKQGELLSDYFIALGECLTQRLQGHTEHLESLLTQRFSEAELGVEECPFSEKHVIKQQNIGCDTNRGTNVNFDKIKGCPRMDSDLLEQQAALWMKFMEDLLKKHHHSIEFALKAVNVPSPKLENPEVTESSTKLQDDGVTAVIENLLNIRRDELARQMQAHVDQIGCQLSLQREAIETCMRGQTCALEKRLDDQGSLIELAAKSVRNATEMAHESIRSFSAPSQMEHHNNSIATSTNIQGDPAGLPASSESIRSRGSSPLRRWTVAAIPEVTNLASKPPDGIENADVHSSSSSTMSRSTTSRKSKVLLSRVAGHPDSLSNASADLRTLRDALADAPPPSGLRTLAAGVRGKERKVSDLEALLQLQSDKFESSMHSQYERIKEELKAQRECFEQASESLDVSKIEMSLEKYFNEHIKDELKSQRDCIEQASRSLDVSKVEISLDKCFNVEPLMSSVETSIKAQREAVDNHIANLCNYNESLKSATSDQLALLSSLNEHAAQTRQTLGQFTAGEQLAPQVDAMFEKYFNKLEITLKSQTNQIELLAQRLTAPSAERILQAPLITVESPHHVQDTSIVQGKNHEDKPMQPITATEKPSTPKGSSEVQPMRSCLSERRSSSEKVGAKQSVSFFTGQRESSEEDSSQSFMSRVSTATRQRRGRSQRMNADVAALIMKLGNNGVSAHRQPMPLHNLDSMSDAWKHLQTIQQVGRPSMMIGRPSMMGDTSRDTSAIAPLVRIGAKVLVGSNNLRGTVRFIGCTQFAEGEWIGLELEEPCGKNDGSVKEIRYFTCPPEHGLFTKIDFINAVVPELETVNESWSQELSDWHFPITPPSGSIKDGLAQYLDPGSDGALDQDSDEERGNNAAQTADPTQVSHAAAALSDARCGHDIVALQDALRTAKEVGVYREVVDEANRDLFFRMKGGDLANAEAALLYSQRVGDEQTLRTALEKATEAGVRASLLDEVKHALKARGQSIHVSQDANTVNNDDPARKEKLARDVISRFKFALAKSMSSSASMPEQDVMSPQSSAMTDAVEHARRHRTHHRAQTHQDVSSISSALADARAHEALSRSMTGSSDVLSSLQAKFQNRREQRVKKRGGKVSKPQSSHSHSSHSQKRPTGSSVPSGANSPCGSGSGMDIQGPPSDGFSDEEVTHHASTRSTCVDDWNKILESIGATVPGLDAIKQGSAASASRKRDSNASTSGASVGGMRHGRPAASNATAPRNKSVQKRLTPPD